MLAVLIHTAVWLPACSSGSKLWDCDEEALSSGHLLVDWAVAHWWRRAFYPCWARSGSAPPELSLSLSEHMLACKLWGCSACFDLWTGLEVHLTAHVGIPSTLYSKDWPHFKGHLCWHSLTAVLGSVAGCCNSYMVVAHSTSHYS